MAEKTKPPPEAPPSIFTKNLVRAPGPGKYETAKYSDFAPGGKSANRWSFGAKTHQRRDDPTPGPDKYSHPRSSFAGTKWTMAARFKTIDRDDMSVPAANDGKAPPPAVVRSFIGTGPKFSMAGRVRPVRSDSTPDPTKYSPLTALKFTTQKVPSYSMAARFRAIDRDPYFVPASGQDGKAVVPPVVKTLIGSGGPKFSMSGRTRTPRDPPMPGPAHYPGASLDMVGKSGPRFSMSARLNNGIAFGHFGDEPRLSETRILPQLQPATAR